MFLVSQTQLYGIICIMRAALNTRHLWRLTSGLRFSTSAPVSSGLLNLGYFDGRVVEKISEGASETRKLINPATGKKLPLHWRIVQSGNKWGDFNRGH